MRDGGPGPSAPRPRLYLAVGLALFLAGTLLAALVERSDGITLSDVRFRTPDGVMLSGLLYRPPGATAAAPAPGVLAVHGYVNTRETQSPFAIEFARRGYVVLALDQRGHGSSGGAAVTRGFGGPEALAYLRALPFVDRAQIGLEGHSMGGWTVLAAAAAAPDAYRALVLEGSTTGAPFARTGTPDWPRNVEVVFSRYDEFGPFMWGARAADVAAAPKMETLFGTRAPVEVGRVYGDVAAGTARRLTQPVATHPGDHLSTVAVADAADWFALTLKGGRPRPRGDQVWWWKEAGTGLGLLGLAVLGFGLFDLALLLPAFAALRRAPETQPRVPDAREWALIGLGTLVPALTYYLLPLSLPLVPPGPLLPQTISTNLAVWALGNALIGLILGRLLAPAARRRPQPWTEAALLAAWVAAPLYLLVLAASAVQVDYRFWVFALRPLSPRQALAALAYFPAFLLFTGVAVRALVQRLPALAGGQSLFGVLALAGGFLLLTGAQYAVLFATGVLPVPAEALNVIVALQVIVLFVAVGLFSVHVWRRTGAWAPAAAVCAVVVTWCLAAGTATHFA